MWGRESIINEEGEQMRERERLGETLRAFGRESLVNVAGEHERESERERGERVTACGGKRGLLMGRVSI